MNLIKRAGVRTDEEKRVRVREVMRLHAAGFSPVVIRRRTGTEPYTARKWAETLGMVWTGKPMRVRNNQEGGAV